MLLFPFQPIELRILTTPLFTVTQTQENLLWTLRDDGDFAAIDENSLNGRAWVAIGSFFRPVTTCLSLALLSTRESCGYPEVLIPNRSSFLRKFCGKFSVNPCYI